MELNILLKLCRAGNQLAWEELVRSHQARVFGIAFSYLGNIEDAKDITQEVFLKIYQNLGMQIDAEAFLPWVCRICQNACIDHFRRAGARPPVRDVPAEEVQDRISHHQDPEQALLRKSCNQRLLEGMRRLTSLNRQLILLKEVRGMSLLEVAALLRIPLGTVKSRSNRARIELAQKLTELGIV